MKTIDISKIIVPPDRQRKEFTPRDLDSLADSITRLGLLHAIVLENDNATLRAGERRLRAITQLTAAGGTFTHDATLVPTGHIPYTTVGELSEDELFEVELEENIQRVNITWQERAVALAKLTDLRRMRAEREGKPFSIRSAAQDIAGPGLDTVPLQVKMSNAQVIAKHLNDDEVSKAKTEKEALNIIKRKQADIIQQELSAQLLKQGFAAGVSSPHSFTHGSMFDLFPTLADSSVDIILTDPPYGIDMDTMNTQSGSASGLTHGYKDSIDYAEKCITEIATQGYRVTRASAVCYMFCDLRLWDRWGKLFLNAGWYVWPHPVIWNKAPTGSLLGSANGPRHVYEAVLMAIKGKKGVNRVGNDVINIAGPAIDKRHPAEKPVDLYAHLLGWSATPGDTILDPCCGCGPIFPAASQFQCNAIGWEYDTVHAATARLRMTSGEIL